MPRYRQRIVSVPGRLANPVWVDDDDFDLTYHVRRSALPRPGSMDQLRELTARIMSASARPAPAAVGDVLHRGRRQGRVAILSKSHQVLVDGVATIDLGQVLLDIDPKPKRTVTVDWQPAVPRPSQPALVAGAVLDAVPRPEPGVPRPWQATQAPWRGSPARSAAGSQTWPSTLTNRRYVPETPINTRLSEQRRFATVRTSLEDYRKVRRFHGGTVNDVILATVTGALRNWLLTRAEPVHSSRRCAPWCR